MLFYMYVSFFNAIINAIKDIMNFNNCYDSNFLNVLFTNEEKWVKIHI